MWSNHSHEPGQTVAHRCVRLPGSPFPCGIHSANGSDSFLTIDACSDSDVIGAGNMHSMTERFKTCSGEVTLAFRRTRQW